MGCRGGGAVAEVEAAKLADSFAGGLASALANMDDAALFALTSELTAIRAVLDALSRTNSAALYDDLWSLATGIRGPLGETSAREVQQGLDAFFRQIADPGVPVDRRVAAIYQMYGILVLVRCADLLKRIRGS